MGQRLDLQLLLDELLEGKGRAYFQPTSDIKMSYPCIVYERNTKRINYANNSPYRHLTRYQVTVIDKDPDSPIVDKVTELQYCELSRHYVADNLNHDSFNLYY